HGVDTVYGNDSPIATQLLVNGKPSNIYFAGISSGLERTPGVSFLQYFSWKSLQLADQVLGRKGPPERSPFASLRQPMPPVQLRGAPLEAKPTAQPLHVENPQGRGRIRRETALTVSNELRAALAGFEFSAGSKLVLTFSRRGG